MPTLDLRDDWADLLERRQSLALSLAPYGPLIEACAGWEPSRPAPTWSAEECAARWGRGVLALAGSGVAPAPDDVEDVMAAAMEALTAAHPEEADVIRRLADAWDARQWSVVSTAHGRQWS